MNKWVGSRVVALVVSGFALIGCGGSDDEDGDGKGACSAPRVEGSPAVDTGTATVQGSGMLPAGIPDGYELSLLLAEGGFSQGVFPQGLFEIPTVCGQAFSFNFTKVGAGTYKLEYEVLDPDSDTFDPAFTGTSTNEFTVTDGATVQFNPTF
jgi:hypothetical protein